MNFSQKNAEIFVPDGIPASEALARTTHLAIGAHQDDLEIMAYDGILACFQHPDKWYCGVVVTDGSGSPRDDLYANFSDAEMKRVRRKEQKKAAVVGEYAAQVLLDHPSSAVKNPNNQTVVNDLILVLRSTRPEIVYTHNLADKHATHIGVTLKVITAIRALPHEERPQKLYGCEVWRDLDWLVDEDKIVFDSSAHENLQAALLGVFDSQICGGKRYDLATMGRRHAHATYFTSHATDENKSAIFAMDLSPLIHAKHIDPLNYVLGYVDRFKEVIQQQITGLLR